MSTEEVDVVAAGTSGGAGGLTFGGLALSGLALSGVKAVGIALVDAAVAATLAGVTAATTRAGPAVAGRGRGIGTFPGAAASACGPSTATPASASAVRRPELAFFNGRFSPHSDQGRATPVSSQLIRLTKH